MSRIKVLSEVVANQIAAGEVVERPSSVVKELVENSIDAEATRISVEIQTGGKSLIRIIDDGIGMDREDAQLCLERHGTSKLRNPDDLQTITTMGFRGEAIPSIASVSRFTLTTRPRGDTTGEATQITVEGGLIKDVKAAGAAEGTTFEIRQLFFNVPVRKKFLKANETERAHIQHYLLLAALSHPEIAFTFRNDGRVIWQLASIDAAADNKSEALQQRLKDLYGTDLKLVAVDTTDTVNASPFEDDPDNHSKSSELIIWGFTGAPGVSRSTRQDQHVFINRRPIENRTINAGLMDGYHTALPKGQYPICCLFVEIHPAFVDVNIHPAKREVKLRGERDIKRIIAEAISDALHERPKSPNIPAPVPNEKESDPKDVQPPAPAPTPFKLQTPPQPIEMDLKAAPKAPNQTSKSAQSTAQRLSPPQETEALNDTHTTEGSTGFSNVPLKLIGLVANNYIIFESDRGMVLMDQRAAHERVLFERMLKSLEEGNAPSQGLLLPETIELSPRDAGFIRNQLTTLRKLGVGLSEFGDQTFLLDSLPPFVKAGEPRSFVIDLIDQLKQSAETGRTRQLEERAIAKTVCFQAVRNSDKINHKEAARLLEDLRACNMPYTCPNGRPTIIEMNHRDLARKFGRL
ncbi:DNA mismatch repair endonuclease MutL [Verrucomicrobia bacterium]|nr:DNA mismatch repair endonuclease MutL [Verrucomicrobiota bacterium]